MDKLTLIRLALQLVQALLGMPRYLDAIIKLAVVRRWIFD